MQALVDWLYQQVDPLQPDGVALINDVVRICLLLASHAPVNQIIAGHVPKATVVQTGGRVELAVDHTKIRVGMSVLMYSPTNEVLARGLVEDLGAGKAAARVVTTVRKEVTLDPGARAHFAGVASARDQFADQRKAPALNKRTVDSISSQLDRNW